MTNAVTVSGMAARQGRHFPRLLVSALSGGGGKTLLSLGLAGCFTEHGLAVKAFKKGPDYIDAAWLALASGRPATNLDTFFLEPAALRRLFATAMSVLPSGISPLALVEGNRGLYDGLDAAGSCSTAGLARILGCPVLLSVSCAKVTRTLGALLQGVLHFEEGLRWCGVVLNVVASARHEALVRRVIEDATPLRVLGALPRLRVNPLPERHMGIASRGSGLGEDARQRLDSLTALVRGHVDVEALLAAARAAGPLPPDDDCHAPHPGAPGTDAPGRHADCALELWIAPGSGTVAEDPAVARPRIGYVHDAAFWFYYAENLQALEQAGAQLVPMRLVDAASEGDGWDSLHGLYLGGGFPEDFLPALSGSPGLARVAALAMRGLPVYAECGGFMLLARGIVHRGRPWPMGGVFSVDVECCERPQGLGYVEGTVCASNPFFPVGLRLRGHEFHYSRCVAANPAALPTALRLSRGRGMGLPGQSGAGLTGQDALVRARVWAAYTHIFAPAVPCWARNFVAAARQGAEEAATPEPQPADVIFRNA